jgi:hypothetical protein
MKSYFWVLLCCCIGIPSFLSGQVVLDSTMRYYKYVDADSFLHHRRLVSKTVINPSIPQKMEPRGIMRVRASRKKARVLTYKGFQENDTLIISVQPIKLKKLKSIILKQNGELLRDVNVQLQDTIVLRDTGDLVLRVRSVHYGFYQKKYADIQLLRIPVAVPEKECMVFDTSFYPSPRGAQVPSDTTWVPLAEFELRPSNTLDILNSPIRSEKIEVLSAVEDVGPLSLIGAWIGLSDESLQAYNKLEETVPPEWAPPGVSVPLGAYCMRKQMVLPSFCRGDIKWAFTDSLGMVRFKRGIKKAQLKHRNIEGPTQEVGFDPNPYQIFPLTGSGCYYGMVLGMPIELIKGAADPEGISNLFFTVANFNTVDVIPTYVKVIGCYISEPAYLPSDQLVVKEINVYPQNCK